MKRATLALAVAALTVIGGTGAAQASTHHASKARHGHSRIHSIHREDRIAVSAGATQPTATEPGDDRIAPIAGTTPRRERARRRSRCPVRAGASRRPRARRGHLRARRSR